MIAAPTVPVLEHCRSHSPTRRDRNFRKPRNDRLLAPPVCHERFGEISKSLHSVHAVPYGARLSSLMISMTRPPCCFGPWTQADPDPMCFRSCIVDTQHRRTVAHAAAKLSELQIR